MAFSRAQQIKFRVLVDKAWKAHCDRECITESTVASKDDWYRDHLRKSFKFDSSTGLNKTNQFEQAMALFEELADDGIYWQMRHLQGDARRARHVLDDTIRNLHLTEDYVNRIAMQMGVNKYFRDYTCEELLNLRIALLTQVRRQERRYLKTEGRVAKTG